MKGLSAREIISYSFLGTAGCCFLFGTSVTVADVLLRAIAGKNVPAAIELTSLSIGLGALLSMPVCYATRTHVTAKLLSEISPHRFTYPLGLIGAAASVVFAALLLWVVGDNAFSKIGSPETTTDLGLSMPLALAVVTLAMVAGLISAIAGLRGAFSAGRDLS